ncbi:MAG: sugar phosphate isomerase/epimerase [Ardenticatenaceae bacterium]|nr:sugar phosphate isomerase/epimerase [Ardenticatenaceae bacterium]MCB9445901.1 sugar phosphate isomerase/epimerase [Ardenticatenaceae bacterium]
MKETSEIWTKIGAFTFDFSRGEWQKVGTAVESYGLELVQLSGELLDEVIESPGKITAVRQQLADHGITITALGAYRNLIAANMEKRQHNIAYLKACLEQANELGTAVVATETGTLHPTGDWSDTPENDTPAAWNALYDALDELLPVAEKAQSFLALEGYVNNVLKRLDQVDQILRRYNSPHLKVMCDPYNYISKNLLPQSAQINDEFLNRFQHEFVIAHLKDVSAAGAEVDTPEFGTGVFPQERYIKFLKTQRPDLPLIFEHLPLAHMPTAVERLQTIAAEV